MKTSKPSIDSELAPARFYVIIPSRNCDEYISQCLDSLLAQTFTDWQALVADDASEDDTAVVVCNYLDDPRITYRRLSKRGWLMGNTVDALHSLNFQPNDVVAILDGDDFIYPTCLEKLWEAHNKGFDLVYTDEDIEGLNYSIGKQIIPSVSPREQLWSFSQLRSFKGYLFNLLEDSDFRDRNGRHFRAAGDLSLYLPMAELAGSQKVHFIPEKHYFYRVHEACNYKIMRDEQLRNNCDVRKRKAYSPQTTYFDFTFDLYDIRKAELNEIGQRYRKDIPLPYTIHLRHHIRYEAIDSWVSYHGLWIDEGIFLSGIWTHEHHSIGLAHCRLAQPPAVTYD